MFFVSSKLIWAVLAPANLVILLILVSAVVARKWKKAGARMMSAAVALFVLLGVMPVGHNLLYSLENEYDRPSSMPAVVTGIIVLGGATETGASGISGMTEFNDGVDRVLAGLALARAYPQARIIFSGGSGRLVNNKRKESQDVSDFLKTIGFAGTGVIYEDQSRNTYENLINSRQIANPQPGEIWLLVTSAFHMRRSMGIAEKIGWDVIPYPVDYRSRGRYLLWPDNFDCLDYLNAVDISVREMIGIAAYRITGKI